MALKWMSNAQRVINYYQEVIVTSTGQQLIELNQAYVPTLNTLIVTLNGLEQAPKKTYIEKTSKSIEFIPDYLRAGDEIRIYFIPNTLNLGDISVVGSHSDLSDLSDREYNSVALSVLDKKFYINKGTEGWKELVDIVAGSTDSWEESNNHRVSYAYNLDGSIYSETVLVGASVIKSTQFEYDSNGNIIVEAITKNGKTITKNYTYDDNSNITDVNILIS